MMLFGIIHLKYAFDTAKKTKPKSRDKKLFFIVHKGGFDDQRKYSLPKYSSIESWEIAVFGGWKLRFCCIGTSIKHPFSIFGREVSGFKAIKRDERLDSGFKANIRDDEDRDTFNGHIDFRSNRFARSNDEGGWINFVVSLKPDDEESKCSGIDVVKLIGSVLS